MKSEKQVCPRCQVFFDPPHIEMGLPRSAFFVDQLCKTCWNETTGEQNIRYREALREAHALLKGGANPQNVAEHIAAALRGEK